jgi:transcriptional regulator with XRE-family HTH domain
MPLSPAQCRAARALLNWSQEDLVAHSKITKKTIADFERGATHPRAQTLAQIHAAFQATGIEFLNAKRPGVRLRARGTAQ